ncbi:chromosome segregation protein SMC [Sutcliffiella rhizosphaerae]|uniref:Chromosome partition protein Smc n=1 Tax=Sutcliffiella rhizosphaerae TaxID=2880967 RepID=A0ABN8A403_9BACI|nr:chromosome segregation protein SMC [Sutcliffiella rhizosphaerae]CAG9619739.1 Chromosome partition protein Smc [Sutcliffiella rhizosphaerae]
MYLKRLEVVGFKSFAERVSVDFVPGVTAVVGPNGSGKSNIIDAIRWVLGEQSAKSLRGSKMEDIIFGGSDSRRALNMAEVTLTLDNSNRILPIDYMEVSVTRRVLRSGDSEFLINKQTCRLKDIVDLFMDSGLGKEAFSIISQGKVEEILSSKAEERRSIFEEAAGVLKYKSRKKKAESKLWDTQENLNRVADILHELEGQVEPLKIQSSIAKDYLEKKEELEQIEVGVTVFEIEELHQKWEENSQSVKESTEKEQDLSAELAKKEATLEKVKDQVAALDESIDSLQQALLVATSELEKLQGKKEVLKERKKNATTNRSQLEKSSVELAEFISIQKNKLTEEQKLLDSLRKELVLTEQQLKEKQVISEQFDQNIEEKIDRLKSEYIELLNRQATIRNEFTHLEQQGKHEDLKVTRLDEGNKKYVEIRKNTLKKKEKVLLDQKTIHADLNEAVDRYRKEQAELEQYKVTYQKRETTLYQAYQYLQQTRARKEMLETMQGDFTGFFQGVKEILKVRDEDRLIGIKGAVAEIIQVNQDVETAIEIALGSATQHIVVDNEQNARTSIQYLKKNGYGRATFLPMSVMKPRILSDFQINQISQHESFVGVAAKLVEFDHEYENIVFNLLGNVVIAKDLKGANALAGMLQHRYRIVTLEGDVVNPGGSMTGGGVKQKSNSLLSRGRELDSISAKLEEMEQKTALLEDQVKSLKQKISEKELQVENTKTAGEELRYKEQQVVSMLREVELEEKNVNEHLSLYDYEKQQLTSSIQSSIDRKKQLEKDLKNVGIQIRELDEEISQLNSLKMQQHATKETVQSELTQLKVDYASKKEKLYNHTEKVDTMKNDYHQAEQRLSDIQEDLALLQSEMNNNSSGEQRLEAAAEEKLQDKNTTMKLITERRAERLTFHEKVENEEVEIKELKRRYKQLTEVLKVEEVKLNRLDVELDNRLHHLREEYMLSFEAAKEEYPLELEIEEARKRLKLIKLAIEELGTVNLAAIEEYERVSERYLFLKDQKDDLQEAKDTLYQVIGEMDEEMKKRFEITFTNIRAHFHDVFRSLFGGGRADLVLTNPNDMLNTGVDIVAQPPGKKLQNLGLLSGGERALTAIALLFSILKVRPVPFCILDEVEAALDEANVHRFAQYLKKFSKETQFIVITHRKGTMEFSDVLYGVTMQESGVSKLVSVRLEESNELVQ